MILSVRLLLLSFRIHRSSHVTQLNPSKSHFISNKSILVKLTRFTIETGLVTAVAALLELILGVVFDEWMYHIAV